MSIRGRTQVYQLERAVGAPDQQGVSVNGWVSLGTVECALYKKDGETTGEETVAYFERWVALALGGRFDPYCRLRKGTDCYFVDEVVETPRYTLVQCHREVEP